MIPLETLKNLKTEDLFKRLSDKQETSSNITEILEEINIRLNTKQYSFSSKDSNEIYTYMFLCNKYNYCNILNDLINDIEFIKVLDNTKINGSTILATTAICQKPRRILLENSKKIKNCIHHGDELLDSKYILEDLTKEEIIILRNDLKIDNFLISEGLCFNTLKESTIKLLMSDVDNFKPYSIYTIVEFANNYSNPDELISNSRFMSIYLDKLNNEYHYNNKIFTYLTKDTLKTLLSIKTNNHILLHLVKDTNQDIQKELLKKSEVQELVYKTNDNYIIEKLPLSYILNILSNRTNLLIGNNLKLIESLDKQTITKLFKTHNTFYKEFIEKIKTKNNFDLEFVIEALPEELLKELCNKEIPKYNINTLTYILTSNNKLIKNTIINNENVCKNIFDELTTKNYKNLETLFKVGLFTPEEQVKFLSNVKKPKCPEVISKIVEKIPTTYRRELYNLESLRKYLLLDYEIELDDYAIKYLLNNIDELKNHSTKTIMKVLQNSQLSFAKEIITNESLFKKLVKQPNAINSIISVLKNLGMKSNYLSLFQDKELTKYFTVEIMNDLLPYLSLEEKQELCTKELILMLLDNNEEQFNTYKKLQNTNRYILNTLDFRLLIHPNIKNIKLSNLEIITKYPSIEDSIYTIDKSYSIIPDFISSLLYITKDIEVTYLERLLALFKDSVNGINRKYMGNLTRILSVLSEKEINTNNIKCLVSYLLYLIPRYTNKSNEAISRPIELDTPSSFNEIIDYENNYNDKLTSMIENNNNELIKKYFIEKHFKLTIEEAKHINKMYSYDRIDEQIYKEEYEYLTSLNKVLNTDYYSLKEMDKEYKVYDILSTFIIEKNIKKMYGKIDNYELRSKNCTNRPTIKNIYGKEIKIYEAANDFLFLVSNVDISKNFSKTNSYFEAWHNTLSTKPYIEASLISNDKLVLNDDIVLGFNGILDESIIHMSNKNTTKESSYMTPRELIDNSRERNNRIHLDKYAVRPNYHNSNLPYIEPDFILIDKRKLEDKELLEKVSRISSEFQTKRNREGLQIIAIDVYKIASKEAEKIDNLLIKYQKGSDMKLIAPILTKLANNYTSYQDENIKKLFNTNNFIKIVEDRIMHTKSLSEIKYSEETFKEEIAKYKSANYPYVTNRLDNLIYKRKLELNK